MKVKSNQEITDFLKPYAASMNIELVEVEFKQGKNPALNVYADKDGGIDLDTLAAFHTLIDAPLDEFDLTFGAAYTLNVSSPGLDRPFKTNKDYEKHLGELIEIKLFAPIKGVKSFEATLIAFDDNTVTVKTEKEELKINRNQVAKACVAIVF